MQHLVCQREEFETYVLQVRSQFKQWSPELQQAFDENKGQYKLADIIVKASERKLILDLIQELQQYILTNQSGTTEMSSIQSNSLEITQYQIEQGQITVQDGLSSVI